MIQYNDEKIINYFLVSLMMIVTFAQSTNVPTRYDINPNAKFQLLPTENRWSFRKRALKQVGCGWKVQYTINGPDNRGTFRLNDESLVVDEE